MSFRFFNSTGQEQIINSVADLPVGAIIDSALPNAPTGWLLCDGSSISRTGFPELFAAIGTFYGSVDANTFTLPDLTGQIIYARPYSLRTTNGTLPQDSSITSAMIVDGTIATADIATGAVTTTQILDGTIAAGDIANSTITSAKLATGATSATYVTTLPSSPVDGQEVYYQADGTNGVIWHLRYRSGSASTYKWEYVGGTALSSEVPASEGIPASGSYGNLATVGPSVTVPLAGDYDIYAGAQLTTNAVNYIFIGLSIDGAGVAEWANMYQDPAGANNQVSRRGVKTVTRGAGSPNTGRILMQYRSGSGQATYYYRFIFAVPIRVTG